MKSVYNMEGQDDHDEVVRSLPQARPPPCKHSKISTQNWHFQNEEKLSISLKVLFCWKNLKKLEKNVSLLLMSMNETTGDFFSRQHNKHILCWGIQKLFLYCTLLAAIQKNLIFWPFLASLKVCFCLFLSLTHTIHKHFLLPLSLIRSLSIYRKCFPVYSYLFAGLKCTRLLSNTLLTKFCKSFNMSLSEINRGPLCDFSEFLFQFFYCLSLHVSIWKWSWF